jgi:hypothetical protein
MPSGPPIHYRRIPGTRRYINPRDPTDVRTEHYVVRIYRPSLSVTQRSEVRTEARQVATRRRKNRSDVASTYQRKVEAENGAYSRSDRDAFADDYARLQQLKFEESSMIGLPERADELADLRAADGEYAQLLVDLGRRPPDADYPVGESPEGISATLNT